MARIILHIGTHKTATTTIQNVFHRNAARLAAAGVIYPHLGRASGHHGLAADHYPDLPGHFRYPGGSLAMWRKIAEQYADHDGTVFLSSETLSIGHPNGAPDYAAIRKILAPFAEVRVLCLLREQWQFMQSVFLEIAKTNTPPLPGEMAQMALKGQYCAGLWVDYLQFHQRLCQSFAPQEITMLDYDAAQRAEGGVLGAVLALLEKDLTPAMLDLRDARANPSPPALPVWAALIASRPDKAPPWLIAEAETSFRLEFGAGARPCLFTEAEFRALKAYFEPRNARLAERLQKVQPGFCLAQTPDDMAEALIWRDRIDARFWVRLTRRLARALAEHKPSAGDPASA